jgi:hypothetical protein
MDWDEYKSFSDYWREHEDIDDGDRYAIASADSGLVWLHWLDMGPFGQLQTIGFDLTTAEWIRDRLAEAIAHRKGADK